MQVGENVVYDFQADRAPDETLGDAVSGPLSVQ
jgi:hypothetical protein